MHYKREDLGFSFELPDGWKRDEHNLTLTFYGPNGGLGRTSELIQIGIGAILPQYFSPQSREKFLAEPGAEVLRSRVGDEDNAVLLKRARDSEISVVRDAVHYTISFAHDAVTKVAIECLKRTARFPSPQQAQSALRSASNPEHQAVARMLRGQSPVPAASTPARTGASKGFLGRSMGLFRGERVAQQCETCPKQMQVLEFSGKGRVSLSPRDLASGIGQAEQCWECARLYCAECYPSRPQNTCVCGRGRDSVRHVGTIVYRGSLRLVKVRYLT